MGGWGLEGSWGASDLECGEAGGVSPPSKRPCGGGGGPKARGLSQT